MKQDGLDTSSHSSFIWLPRSQQTRSLFPAGRYCSKPHSPYNDTHSPVQIQANRPARLASFSPMPVYALAAPFAGMSHPEHVVTHRRQRLTTWQQAMKKDLRNSPFLMCDARKTSQTSDRITPSRVNHLPHHIHLSRPQFASCALLRASSLYCTYCFYYHIGTLLFSTNFFFHLSFLILLRVFILLYHQPWDSHHRNWGSLSCHVHVAGIMLL